MPQIFSNREYGDMHFIYGFCNGNALAAVREYRRRFPQRRVPDRSVFIRIHQQICNTGTVHRISEDHRFYGSVHNRNRTRRILNVFDNNPEESIRRASHQLQIPRSTIWRTLHGDDRYPFHYTPVQELLPTDYEKRIRFCEWYMRAVLDNNDFQSKILWTDEATFTRAGLLNTHNNHQWRHENPHSVRERGFQQQFKCNVWAGICNDKIFGPHFLPERLTAQSFLDFLQNELQPELIGDIPLLFRQNLWIQLDGCPAHYAVRVRQWLNDHYPQRWIGRGGPIPWPPRSPDITPMDFYLWGTVKEKVYQTRINTRQELMQKICDVFAELKENRQEISNTIDSIFRRCQSCINNNGQHFEMLL